MKRQVKFVDLHDTWLCSMPQSRLKPNNQPVDHSYLSHQSKGDVLTMSEKVIAFLKTEGKIESIFKITAWKHFFYNVVLSRMCVFYENFIT